MLLAFDIGNSTIAVAVFDGRTKHAAFSVASGVQRSSDEMWSLLLTFLKENNLTEKDIRDVGICSVVPFLTSTLSSLCLEKIQLTPLVISGDIDCGMKIHYTNPSTLGPDRICSAVAGFDKYGGPLIIVDFGTATTFGVVNINGDFLGGSIGLGVVSTANALSQRTAQLPNVELHLPSKTICTDTTTAIQSGTMFGAIDSVEGMVRRIRGEVGVEAKVVATGGLSTLMSAKIKTLDLVEPSLVLEGIRLICERHKLHNIS